MENELSIAELESEIAAALPERALMHHHRRHHRRHFGGTSASNGSVANSNRTNQVIFNPQVAIVTGGHNGVGITQVGGNTNNNTNTQFGVPINFSA